MRNLREREKGVKKWEARLGEEANDRGGVMGVEVEGGLVGKGG